MQKQLVSFLSLSWLIIFVTHFFGCIWIYIGVREFEEKQDGWIWVNSRATEMHLHEGNVASGI